MLKGYNFAKSEKLEHYLKKNYKMIQFKSIVKQLTYALCSLTAFGNNLKKEENNK